MMLTIDFQCFASVYSQVGESPKVELSPKVNKQDGLFVVTLSDWIQAQGEIPVALGQHRRKEQLA